MWPMGHLLFYVLYSIKSYMENIGWNFLHWKLFVKSWVPFTQESFVPSLVEVIQVSLKLALWLWRKKTSQDITAISLLSLFGKGCSPSFEHTLFLLTRGCFVPSLVEIDQLVREKNIFIAILLLSPLETGHGPSIKNFIFLVFYFVKFLLHHSIFLSNTNYRVSNVDLIIVILAALLCIPY